MEITLNADDVTMLVAVEQGRVEHDPRFTAPDFEVDPGPPVMRRRATQRLRPFKRWQLVDLVDEDQADQYGVRAYRLTQLGARLLDEARAQEALALAEADTWGTPTDSPAASAAGATRSEETS
ncbi:hypothetical protein [Phytohabitans aurantiacus]|uniref:Uncharacterized protein n=1 Tax=Phytohabitans aurantiacus TaxID=3016789 RepID=A0ABQ5QKI6_9ACTN|nr:hypothetical protein [Phytohabitans aurantiacus]GLH94918.1 hypothetical protein Pa4123_01900 [Phytohabitans aurantiacus]